MPRSTSSRPEQLRARAGASLDHPAGNELPEDEPADGIRFQEIESAAIFDAEPLEERRDRVPAKDAFLADEGLHPLRRGFTAGNGERLEDGSRRHIDRRRTRRDAERGDDRDRWHAKQQKGEACPAKCTEAGRALR